MSARRRDNREVVAAYVTSQCVRSVHWACVYVYTAARRRPQTSSPVRPASALSAGFVPIDPARPPSQRQQQPPPQTQQAPVRRRRLPDIPKAEEAGHGGCVPATGVVLRQRPVDDRRPRPHSGVGTADLGVAATAVLYAAASAANRDSCHSVRLSPGELLSCSRSQLCNY